MNSPGELNKLSGPLSSWNRETVNRRDRWPTNAAQKSRKTNYQAPPPPASCPDRKSEFPRWSGPRSPWKWPWSLDFRSIVPFSFSRNKVTPDREKRETRRLQVAISLSPRRTFITPSLSKRTAIVQKAFRLSETWKLKTFFVCEFLFFFFFFFFLGIWRVEKSWKLAMNT